MFLKKNIQKRIFFLNKFKLISEKCIRFQQKKSCVDAEINFTEFIRNVIDKRQKKFACLIDLTKALDTLSHGLLLQKLENFGFRGVFLDIMKSYLESRHQYVISGTECSEKLIKVYFKIRFQEHFFLILINDMPKYLINSNCTLFADDTTVYTETNLTGQKFTEDLIVRKSWFLETGLTVNIKKM